VHFPTDINLLWDALRKAIQISAQFCTTYDLSEWRQSQHLLRTIKKNYRLIQKLKHSTSKDEVKRQVKQDEIKEAHQVYIDQAQRFVQRARNTSRLLTNDHGVTSKQLIELESYLTHADRQINQIRRRVLQGETIPHEEKVFSLFQPHTEWIRLTSLCGRRLTPLHSASSGHGKNHRRSNNRVHRQAKLIAISSIKNHQYG
jgi:hypothetical protein